jgi:hypothetical protein
VKHLRYDTYRRAHHVEDPFEGPTDGLQLLHLEQGKVLALWALAKTVFCAGAQRGFDILREGLLGGSDASIEVRRVFASDTTALSPVNEGEQLVQTAMEGHGDLVLLATRA